MKEYLDAVREILETGTRKESRTGVDTLSTFGLHYNIDLRDGFPLLTTKEISWKNIVVELLWFLSGEPDIGFLRKHKCKFWDAWAEEDGTVPSSYGSFWRRFPVHASHSFGSESNCERCGVYGPEGGDKTPCLGWNDQIAWVLAELKSNPNSRRLVVEAWAPGNAQTSKLPPCHLMFVLNVQNLPVWKLASGQGSRWWDRHTHAGDVVDRMSGTWCGGLEKCSTWIPGRQGRCIPHGGILETKPHLCLHLTQRSCDIALGVPYNIASYALLLELFSRFSGIPAGIFSHTLVDAHAYTRKADGSQAEYDHVPGLREQLTRAPRARPRLSIGPDVQDLQDIDWLFQVEDTDELLSHFELGGYNPAPKIPFKVAV